MNRVRIGKILTPFNVCVNKEHDQIPLCFSIIRAQCQLPPQTQPQNEARRLTDSPPGANAHCLPHREERRRRDLVLQEGV